MNEKSQVETLDSQLDELEPPYESNDEARIGRMLDKYGIPFFYKQATIIYCLRLSFPVFTLLEYENSRSAAFAIPANISYVFEK